MNIPSSRDSEYVNKENFPKMKKDVNLQIEKIYCVPWNFDENIMLALRMNTGVDKSLLGEKVKVLEEKFASFIIDKGDKIALNGKGMDVMNHILVEIL